jgi:sortase (surface protein transpeptidase)
MITAAVLVLTACGTAQQHASHRYNGPLHQGASVAPTQAATRETPARLVIPSLGVTAKVEQVGVDGQGNMAIPKHWQDVGWYAPGVAPGQPGDAVIDGHLDWWGVPHAVFYYLSALQLGAEIDVLTTTGTIIRFKVTGQQSVAYSSHPAGLFAAGGTPRLSLITCTGVWDAGKRQYTQRLIVNATEMAS